MDTIKNMVGGGGNSQQNPQQQNTDTSSGGGWSDKLNSMAGGGKASEKNEDGLDKGGFLCLSVHETITKLDFARRRLCSGACPRPGTTR